MEKEAEWRRGAMILLNHLALDFAMPEDSEKVLRCRPNGWFITGIVFNFGGPGTPRLATLLVSRS